MSLEKELEKLQDDINDELIRVQPIVDYVCMFCGKTYGEPEHALEHSKTCLRNMYDVKSCVTCKHSCYNLKPTYSKQNGYDKLVSEGITSRYGYFTCERENKIYDGKLTEEKVLKLNKSCYEPLEYGESFMVKRTDDYEEYVTLLDEIDKEQDKINQDIEEFWNKVDELDSKGLSKEEILGELEKEYSDE